MQQFYINKLAIEQCEISKKEALLFEYPHHIDRIIRMQLVNNDVIINYTEKKFANQDKHGLFTYAQPVKAQKNDSIIIEYIPKEYSQFICTLRIENIYEYYCDAYKNDNKSFFCKRKESSLGPLDGLPIRIAKSASQDSPLYFLNCSDWFGVFSDSIVVQNIRYK